jgi:type IV secretion system protein VirD4
MTKEAEPFDLVPVLCAALGIAFAAWLLPTAVTWAFDGSLGAMSPAGAVRGTIEIVRDSRWEEPAEAYPPQARAHMPAGAAWWLPAGWFAITATLFALAGWKRLEPAVSRTRLGRRAYDPRGARPRSWALPRDLAGLTVPHRSPDRFTLGHLDGRLLASDDEAHVAVIAPTRSGKTTRCVVPWLLEHDGPAIVTSTKTDVVASTRTFREQLGRVQVWDPFGEASAAWSPIESCKTWEAALLRAQWLADAVQEGDSEIAAYWRGEAAKLLAPLLHAAALDELAIGDVLSWVDAQDAKRPGAILEKTEAEAAKRQLDAVVNLDPRNRGTTYMSAGSLLAAYRFPAVARNVGAAITADAFLDGGANTIYVVAPERQQRLLAPLVVAMLASILDEAAERANRASPLDPTLRVLLDEAANIAPLRALPAYLSQAAGYGVRIATIWQSVAQIRARYRTGADAILANSTAKLFMGPVGDEATISYLHHLLGDERVQSESKSTSFRPKAHAGALQQLDVDLALLIEGRLPPAIVRLTPWWEDRRLRARAASHTRGRRWRP